MIGDLDGLNIMKAGTMIEIKLTKFDGMLFIFKKKRCRTKDNIIYKIQSI